MLSQVRVQHFRSFGDTGELQLRKLNIFLGPNNAGKSALVGAIELFLRSLKGAGQTPLAFVEMPSFASFDSVLRRHWTPNEPRARKFELQYVWNGKTQPAIKLDFVCAGKESDNVTYVKTANYEWGEKTMHAVWSQHEAEGGGYDVTFGKYKIKRNRVVFRGPVPMLFDSRVGAARVPLFSRHHQVEVINPSRPVPRSFYVLDDPGLAANDRELLAYLVDLWSDKGKLSGVLRTRILNTFSTLGLLKHLKVRKLGQRAGPKVIEIQVAPSLQRQAVTIADVGFGVSQILPLVVADARLSNGYFVAYQPEMHLHPYAQSRLADVFTESIARGNQLFIETHSVDMVLRLQAKVVSGELSNDDVAVFCLENSKGATSVKFVTLDELGAPRSPWPTGFLDVSLNLARDLTARRLERQRG